MCRKDRLRGSPRTHTDELQRGISFLADCQGADGSWKGDYGGSYFLTPMWAAALASMGVPIDDDLRSGFLKYMASRRNPDGGWGLHTESPSTLFSTVLTHVALRVLGARLDDPLVESSLGWIRAHGGAVGIPLWGKLFLATLNLYHYDGVPPLCPELWLLPRAAPLHPGRIWCHARVVLLAMSHLYGRRFRLPSTPLIRAIRSEIYSSPFEEIDWRRQRERVSPTDAYVDQPGLSRVANLVLGAYERIPGFRRRALTETLDHIHHEDDTTDHIDIGPVNKLMNMMVAWFEEGPESVWFASHAGHIADYLWETDDGVHVNGYNSTAMWDTAFAVQALVATPQAADLLPVLARAHGFIEANQVLDDVPDHERYYRHRSRGGWPFSNRPHGWPISDCTGEGLKAALALQDRVEEPIAYERLRDAVELILSLQNPTGGWATYELTRGSRILEKLNSSALFSGIMVDYDYPECTSSCLQGLAAFRRRYPTRLAPGVELAVSRGREYLLSSQNPDGSWYGSWGVCFTYGTWFGTWGLLAAGLEPGAPALRRAVRFLLSHQNPDGGWGEHWTSCTELRYVPSSESQVVMTSWALLALMACGFSSPDVERGLGFLRRTQLPSGDWPREPIEGVFNRTCMIHYDNYRNYFPIWALGLASERNPST
ncbi:MAG: terpene cyclase/mutase family protein [Deltaproteobacteria bacterium]|nr:terpene cyclase/mutase family protein [Deltaproteobacteria bacterium]